MLPPTYRIRAIDQRTLEELRQIDDVGRRPATRTDDQGGWPMRCCLRLSKPGERIALVAYAPLRRWAAGQGIEPGAYDEVGPVFIHSESCDGPASDAFPDQFRHSPRVLRSYNYDGTIRGGVLVQAGGPFEATLQRLFDDVDVAIVHARALDAGCFTFSIERAA